ncbi:hypothetical protein D3C76_1036310 [compost metagenome]
MVEEELQTAVEYRVLRQVIVVQHQQQGLAGLKALGDFIEQTVQPLLEGERLVALAHLQVAHGLVAKARVELAQAVQQPLEEAPGVAVATAEAEPEALPTRRQAFAELDGQRTLAEAGRRTEHQQAAVEAGGEAFAQARTQDMAGGLRWAEKARVGHLRGGRCHGSRTGQDGHYPASRNVLAGARTWTSLAVQVTQ